MHFSCIFNLKNNGHILILIIGLIIMDRNELLDRLEALGLSSNARLDLEQRNVNKKSLNEIISFLTKEQKGKKLPFLDTEDDWVKRTYGFSGISHLLLLIYSPRLYVFMIAPIKDMILADALDDMKIYIDSAVNGYETIYYGLSFNLSDYLDNQSLLEGDYKIFNDPVFNGITNLIPTFKKIKIERGLVYKKLEEANIILKENWSAGLESHHNEQTLTEFYAKVAQEREQFYMDITKWV